MAHRGHSECPFTSKAACDKARRVAIGHCVSMLDEDRQCPNWGVDRVEDRPYCGQHVNSVYLAADRARREAARVAELHDRIDRAIAWHVEHPSVWDPLPSLATSA